MKGNKVNFLLNEYLETHGELDIQLPDDIKLKIGITQEGQNGPERQPDYC